MARYVLLLPLMVAATGCETSPRPYAPIENVHYAALGADPFWMVTIGDDSIVLSFGAEPGAERERISSQRYPRTLSRTVDGVRRWESSSGTAAISVEAMEGPCEGARGLTFRDRVRVRLNGREMHGCGGPQLDRRG